MEYIWTTKDGKSINVDHMDVNHLRNSLKLCMRRMQELRNELARLQKPKRRFHVNGEIASEHADAYEIYKATGIDILNDDAHLDEWGI
jgi:hypothetical protein